MENLDLVFLLLTFGAALLYASVGHGGASGYLALMALYGVAPATMKPAALLLNLFVSGIAFYQFARPGHFKFRIFVPLAIASVPLAFLGGMITLDSEFYKRILGLLLLFPVARFLFMNRLEPSELRPSSAAASLGIGAALGLLSGLIGIGGGILLSPLLLLLRWTDQKQTAALSAAFIFLNSLSGLLGQFSQGVRLESGMVPILAAAIMGGGLGAGLGALKFSSPTLRRTLATVLAVAAFKLLLTGR